MESLPEFISILSSDSEEEAEPETKAPSHAQAGLSGCWTAARRYAASDPFLVLHEDIIDFCDAFVPTVHEHACRRESLELVAEAVSERWPGAQAIPFGSYTTGLYLPLSDVDVGLRGLPDGSKKDKERTLHELAQLLRERGLAREDASAGHELEVIASARVPILRFVHAAHLLPMDLTLDADSGCESTTLMRSFASELPEFSKLVVVLKLWLQRRGLHETYNGGIGSFLLQLMVAAMLKLRPLAASRARVAEAAQARAAALASSGQVDASGHTPWAAAPSASSQPSPEQSLGSALLDFFELYGVKLNYRTTGLSLRHGGAFFEKRSRAGWLCEERPHLLSVENPLAPDADAGRAAFNIGSARRAFSQSYYQLLSAMRGLHQPPGAQPAAAAARLAGSSDGQQTPVGAPPALPPPLGGAAAAAGAEAGAEAAAPAAPGPPCRLRVLGSIFDPEAVALMAQRHVAKFAHDGAALQPSILVPPPLQPVAGGGGGGRRARARPQEAATARGALAGKRQRQGGATGAWAGAGGDSEAEAEAEEAGGQAGWNPAEDEFDWPPGREPQHAQQQRQEQRYVAAEESDSLGPSDSDSELGTEGARQPGARGQAPQPRALASGPAKRARGAGGGPVIGAANRAAKKHKQERKQERRGAVKAGKLKNQKRQETKARRKERERAIQR